MEDDDISITSTIEDKETEDKRYCVVKILAEEIISDELHYLIEWEGYPITASTWEPREHIESHQLLREWTKEKESQAKGTTEPFDLESWEANVLAETDAQLERRRRRREKRKSIGILVSPSPPEQESELVHRNLDISAEAVNNFEEREDFNEPVSNHLKNYYSLNDFDVLGGDHVIMRNPDSADEIPRLPSQQRREKDSYSSDEAGLSEDSLINEFKEKAKRKEERAARRETEDESRRTVVADRKPKLGRKESSGDKLDLSKVSSERQQAVSNPTKSGNRFSELSKWSAETPSKTGYAGTANLRIERKLNGPAIRRSTVARGAGAVRGSTRGSLFKSSLSTRAPVKPRKNLAAALLAPPKNSSHFKTPSMRRKAELAGRNLADRAPDFDSIGPLYAPAQFKIRKKHSSSNPPSQVISSSVHLLDKESPGNDAEKNSAVLEFLDPSPPIVDDDNRPLIEEPDKSFHSESSVSKSEQEKTALTNKLAALDAANRAARAKIASARRESSGHVRFDKSPPAISLRHDVLGNDSCDTSGPFQSNSENPNLSVGAAARNWPTNESTVSHDNPQTILQPAPKERPPLLKKMSMDAYRARNTTKSLLENGVQIGAIIGNPESKPLELILTDIKKSSLSTAVKALLSLKKIELDRTCLAADFQRHVKSFNRQISTTGNVVAVDSASEEVDSLAENLMLSVSSLAFIQPAFTLILFPSQSEEWKFLFPQEIADSEDNTMLKYHIFGAMENIAGILPKSTSVATIATTESGESLLEKLNNDILGLHYQRLIPSNQSGGKNFNYFFLMFPSNARSLLKHIATWLLACNPDRQMFTSQQAGSWAVFTELAIVSGGVIIIHESLLSAIFEIPNLTQLLDCSTLWVTGECDDKNPRFSRLFPDGGAILLTPSFLCAEPKRTYQILKWFQKLHALAPWFWQLCGCFKLRQYLFDLAIHEASQRQRLLSDISIDDDQKEIAAIARGLTLHECQTRFRVYELVEDMLQTEMMAGSPYGLDEDHPNEGISPIAYAIEGIGQNDEKGLAEWFAYWSMSNLTKFRKFVVLGTSPSVMQSRRRSDTTTPVSYIQGTSELESAGSPPTGSFMDQRINRSDSQLHGVPDLQLDNGRTYWSSTIDLTESEKAPLVKNLSTRIDESVPPEILEFIDITASDTVTAKHFLSLSNNSVPLATQKYFAASHSSGLDGINESPFLGLVSGSESVDRSHAVKSDLQRATNLFKSPPPHTPLSFTWPPQRILNGNSQKRDKTKSSVRDATSADRSSTSQNASRRQSRQEDGFENAEMGTKGVVGEDGNRSGWRREGAELAWDGEATTEWYARLKAEGRGWEHIEVVDWETGFRNLGITE